MRLVLLALLLLAPITLHAQTARLVADLRTDVPDDQDDSGSIPQHLTPLDGKLYFSTSRASGESGFGVWVYDPGSDQTERLTATLTDGSTDDPLNAFVFDLLAFDGLLFISAWDGARTPGTLDGLWIYDPATGSLEHPTIPFTDLMTPVSMTAFDGDVYFAQNSAGFGQLPNAVWRYNLNAGTVEEAFKLTADSDSDVPALMDRLVVAEGALWAFVSTGIFAEFWRYDGTTATREMRIGATDNATLLSYSDEFAYYQGAFYFAYDDRSDAGLELWRFVTATKTAERVVDLYPGQISFPITVPYSSQPAYFAVLGGKLYFAATNAENGREMFVYDAATNEAAVAVDIANSPQFNAFDDSSDPAYLTPVGDVLYLAASSLEVTTSGHELWRYDPATGTATLVADVDTRPDEGGLEGLAFSGTFDAQYAPVVFDESLFFSASNGVSGEELFAFDLSNATSANRPTEADEVTMSAVAPNPVANHAALTLRVSAPQQVRATVYDLLGRTVAHPFAGPMTAGAERQIVLDTEGLPGGLYVLVVQGERFRETRAFSVVR